MTWVSPFSLPGSWFKGNLHTHTTQSDGAVTVAEAEAWYRDHGYDFLAITDHWVFTPGHRFDGADDFITIGGTELHGPGYHLLTVGLDGLPPREVADAPQTAVDAVLERGGLAYFAHPYWTNQTSADMAPIEREHGIEVYNTGCDVAVGLGYSRVHWDDLLAQGRRLTALAVDDVHWRQNEQGGGWVMVRAERLDERSILDALAAGNFYSSTGPDIVDMRVVTDSEGQKRLSVHCSPCQRITFYGSGPNGRCYMAPSGETISSASQVLRPEQVYQRVECQDSAGGIAWSNPVYVADLL